MRRIRFAIVLVLAVLLVNLPLVHATWTEHRGDASARAEQADLGAFVVVTLVADVALAIVALLFWRYGGRRRRPQLRALALGDVERCPPGVALERIREETYLVRGEVVEVADDRVVIELGDRSVLVWLDGHQNPVGHQQAAQVTARLV
jgi:hypothetical protein